MKLESRSKAWKKFAGKYKAKTAKPKAAAAKASDKYYPAEDVKQPLHRRFAKNAPKLRKSITPGTVLILLAGRFKGQRVVFLKQLESGLLLITGPFAINGVPLRRVGSKFVIATSVKLDVSKVDVPKNIDDKFFAKAQPEQADASKTARIAAQKSVDSKLLPVVKAKGAVMKSYLRAKFSLSKGQAPHTIKF